MPSISIIVPVYNVEKYLDQCIRSILDQTYQDFELILVDDGSTDNSLEICNRYAKQDDRIRVVHKPNGGLSSARNSGIDVAKGQYIGFVDSDDWIDPDMYQLLHAVAMQYGAQMVDCSLRYVYADGTSVNETANTGEVTVCGKTYALHSQLKWTCFRPTPPTKLYSAKLFEGGLRYPLGVYHEDEFFTYQLIYRSELLVYIDAAKYNYRKDRIDSITSVFKEKSLDNWLAFRGRLNFFSEHKDLVSLVSLMREHYIWVTLDLLYKCHLAKIRTPRVKRIIATMQKEYFLLMETDLPSAYKFELSLLYQSYRLFCNFRSSGKWKKFILKHRRFFVGKAAGYENSAE